MARGWQGVVVRDPSEPGYESRRPYKFQCRHEHCYWSVSCKDQEDAINQQNTHPCPWWGGQTKVSWSVAKTLVEQMWEMLDVEYQVLAADNFNNDIRKARARAIAECIALFMKPHFVTSDDVIREAKKRYENGEEYETPGLGARRFETEPPYTTGAVKPRRGAPKPPKPSSLDEKTKATLKFALESGMFTPEQLAKNYGVSVDEVNALK